MTKKASKTAEKTPFKETKSHQNLPCILTEVELKESSELMANANRKIKEAEARLKSATTQIKSEIAEYEGARDKHAERIMSKTEYRNVECRVEWHFSEKVKKVYRLDTGEYVQSLTMLDSEFQENLKLQTPTENPVE